MILPQPTEGQVDRRRFIELCALLGLGTTMSAVAASCNSTQSEIGSDDHVIIIGAGPAGLAAGHLLAQRRISFEILEAQATHGGRTKRASDFVDFPIPLGAEWGTTCSASLPLGLAHFRTAVRSARRAVDEFSV